MKKLFILSFASILMLTGCGATETLSCSYQNSANNGSTKIKYDIDHEEDEIKKVRITYDYNFMMNNDNNNGNNTETDNGTGNNARTRTTDRTNDNNNDDDEAADLDGASTYGTNGNNGNNTGNAGNTNGNTGNTNGNNGMTTYNNNDNTTNNTDGVGTGTDGTTNDTQIDDDGIVDGVVGSAIDTIVGGVTDIILDSAGLRDRHSTVQNTYANVNGFSVQNTRDQDDNYMVTYVIDYDTISDTDLARFNLSRDLDTMRDNYVNQGFTCK